MTFIVVGIVILVMCLWVSFGIQRAAQLTVGPNYVPLLKRLNLAAAACGVAVVVIGLLFPEI